VAGILFLLRGDIPRSYIFEPDRNIVFDFCGNSIAVSTDNGPRATGRGIFIYALSLAMTAAIEEARFALSPDEILLPYPPTIRPLFVLP
jgi:hypothetical protein